MPVRDSRLAQVVRADFDGHAVARENSDVVHPHFSRNMSQNHMSVFQLDPEGRIREILQNLALHLNHVIFGHIKCLFLSINGAQCRP